MQMSMQYMMHPYEEASTTDVLLSPGLQGLHGAANLLKEIAQGWGYGGSHPPPLYLSSAAVAQAADVDVQQSGPEQQLHYQGQYQAQPYGASLYHQHHVVATDHGSSGQPYPSQSYEHHQVAGVMVSALSNPAYAQQPPPLQVAQESPKFGDVPSQLDGGSHSACDVSLTVQGLQEGCSDDLPQDAAMTQMSAAPQTGQSNPASEFCPEEDQASNLDNDTLRQAEV